MSSNFYKLVPKTLEANLRFRVNLRKRAAADEGYRRAMMTACKHDVLFFFNAFCFLFEPRPRFFSNGKEKPKTIPFITWEHQDPVILEIKKYLGTRDIGVEKARGEGMSWIGVLLALHDWLFDDMAKIGLVSNTEDKADDPGNMDSLGAKLDWELTKLPVWMTGRKDFDWVRNLSEHSWWHKGTGGQINAFAATADTGRSGRYKWFMPDELAFWMRPKDRQFMASVRSSTDSRLVISTPFGNEGAYFDFMHTPSNAIRLVLDWKDNPSKNRGMYRLEKGKPVAVDVEKYGPLPESYQTLSREVLDMFSRLRAKGFTLERRLRSPWYDNECDKADATPQSIAQELDRDYGGSMHRIFTSEFFEKAELHLRKPDLEGVMDYHPETLEPRFGLVENGPVKLWMKLDNRLRPPNHPFVVGCDVSTGLGGSHTSNSSIEAFDQITNEQVLEVAQNTVEPADWADTAIAICKWLNNAYLGWEHNGPGGAFTKRVIERNYNNCYYRKVLWKKTKTVTKELGWWTSDKSVEVMMSELHHSVKSETTIIHSKALVQECGQYVRMKGSIKHVGSERTEDDSIKGKAHGDRVMGFAVCLQAAKDRPVSVTIKSQGQTGDPPRDTMAYREKEYQESLQDERDEWDGRTNDDLAKGTYHARGGGRSLAA
jgi:hypothetical protein